MQMKFECGVEPDGALRFEVVSDEFDSVDEFLSGPGLKLALKGLDQSISDGTDIRLVQAVENSKKNGGDVVVKIVRSDGSEVPHT